MERTWIVDKNGELNLILRSITWRGWARQAGWLLFAFVFKGAIDLASQRLGIGPKPVHPIQPLPWKQAGVLLLGYTVLALTIPLIAAVLRQIYLRAERIITRTDKPHRETRALWFVTFCGACIIALVLIFDH